MKFGWFPDSASTIDEPHQRLQVRLGISASMTGVEVDTKLFNAAAAACSRGREMHNRRDGRDDVQHSCVNRKFSDATRD